MIFRVVIVRGANLHSLRIITLGDIVARIPLLRRLWVSGNPHKLLRARHRPILLLHNLHALTSTVAGLPFTFTVDNGLICRTTDRQHPCPSLPGGELIDGPTNALFALGKKRFFTVAPLASRSSALVLRCDPACPKAFLRLPLL